MKRTSGGWVRRVLPFLSVQPRNLVLAFAAVTVAGAGSATLLLIQRQVLDLAVAGELSGLWIPLVLLVGIGVLIYVAQRIGAYRELKAANEAQFLLYDAVHRRMQQIDGGGQALSPGQLAARLNSDIGAMSRAIAALPKLAGSALSTAATVALMLTLSPLLGAVTLVVVPLLLLVVRRARGKVRPATWDAQQREAEVAQAASEAIAGVRVVKAMGQEQHEIDRMTAISTVLYAARMRLTRLQAVFQPILESISSLVQVIVVVLGGWLVLRHELSLGTFLAFSAFSGQLVGTVNWFADTVLGLQEAGVCANRVLDLLDLPPAVVERPDARELGAVRGAVRLDRVSFAHADAAPTLDGFDLRIAAGETVALVGVAGSGKSTVVKLLGRFHDVLDGAVSVDGIDVRDVTLASLRRQVGVVFDEPMLFTGTIRDNVVYGRPDADQADVVTAAQTAGAHDFISALPDGYETVVGERGHTLSGGQRQRIALARTLLTRPRILVLDDATGAVDPRLEREIHRRLRESAGDRTTIFVGYRPSTMAVADRIVVVDAGRVVDEGRHEELLERCPLYRRLVDPATAREAETDRRALAAPDAGGITPSAWTAPEHGSATDPLRGDAAMRAAVARLAPLRASVGAAGRVNLAGAARPELAGERFSLRRLLWPHRSAFAGALALLVVQTGVGVLSPYVTRSAVDRGILAGSMHGLTVAALTIFGLSVVGLLLAPVTLMVAGRVGQRVVFALRSQIWSHLVRLPIAYYERQKTGRLLTRMSNDVESFSGLVSTGLVNALVSGLTLVGVLLAMLAVSPLLAALVLAVVLPFVVLLRMLNRRILAAYTRAREQVADANAALQENLAGVREAQTFGQQGRQHAEYRRLTRRYLDSRLAAERLIAASFPITSFLGGLGSALVLGVGAVMLGRGSLTAGELIAFVLWVAVFFGPIVQLAGFFSDYKRVQVSTRRIEELMKEEAGTPAPAEPVRPERLSGELRLAGVRFRYPGTKVDVLSGVDLTIPAGATVAFVGATGAGKSTIFKLLARFYDPTAGQVLVDEVDLRSLDPAEYRTRLGYLPQEPYLFSGTIRDNIAYGRPDASDAEIESAARAVGAHEGICGLRSGYLQLVGQRGGALSAGLRQLVCLARAYLVDPAIVLLDEATANLDLASEARVLAAMRAVTRGRTTVMIAHRLQTAMEADLIAVVSDGRIVESGTHDELLAIGGRYAGLHEASVVAPVAA